MNYNSKIINSRNNSYGVTITFTNYSIISDFLIEVAEVLETRINILDNKTRVEDSLSESSEIKITTPKFFSSTISIDKYDLMKLISEKSGKIVKSISNGISIGDSVVSNVIESITEAMERGQGKVLLPINRRIGR